MSGVKGVSLSVDSIANAAPIPKGTNKIPSCEADALCSADYLNHKANDKAPIRAKSKVTMTSLPKFSDAKIALGAEL